MVEQFLKDPTAEKLLKLKKDDTFPIVQELHLEVQRYRRKTLIIRKIAEHMVDNDIFKEEI